MFDYQFDMKTKTWVGWMDSQPEFKIKKDLAYADIIVPTADSVRYTYFLDLLMKNDNHVLFTGNTGTGKTVNIQKVKIYERNFSRAFVSASCRTVCIQSCVIKLLSTPR